MDDPLGQICQFAPDSILEETSKCFTKQLGEVKVCIFFVPKIFIRPIVLNSIQSWLVFWSYFYFNMEK